MQTLVAAAQTPLVKQLLPLLDHAVAAVVQHHDLDGQVIGRNGLQFTDVHADTRIPVDVDHQAVALRKLRAHRGRQSEPHGSHAARSEPQARTAKIEVLRGPHLVLTVAGRNDGLALGQAVDLFDDVVRLDRLAGTIVIHGVLRLQFVAMPVPFRPVAPKAVALSVINQGLQGVGHQADVAPVDPLDLVDLRRVDVQMGDELGLTGKFPRISRDAVVEARPQGN